MQSAHRFDRAPFLGFKIVLVNKIIKGPGRCCKRFAHRASPLSLYASTACEDGFPSSQWIDPRASRILYFFGYTPTHLGLGSLAELSQRAWRLT